ncbi:MAG: AbrB/MazE/SpoVT family DNA-binding domain-containing protein [Clostridiales bacterium]|jgi:AbrB family looped-hinge helix DNA binding protein|nr:AbrB/MazE/SpoVT family DNA-binding domain-containing protein [Clostridiales bacterium]
MALASNYFVDNAKVMAKGQITLPKDIREILGLGTGSRVTLVCEGDRVVMMNAAVYAMRQFQEAMKGEAEKAGLNTEEDVVDLVMEMRYGKRDGAKK